MKIVHTVPSLALSAGGPTRSVTSLCTALGQQGAQVELVSMQEAELLIPSAQWVNTTLVPADRSSLRHPLQARSMRAALLQRCQPVPPTVVHDHGIWTPSNHTAVTVARATGVPLIISPHGMLEPWALSYRAWKKRAAWPLYQRRDLLTASVLHATAEQEVSSLRRLGLRQPIAMIPNGVEFPAPADVASAMASRLCPAAAPQRERTALFLSRIHPKKGLINLIDAWACVRPEGWRLVIAGPDESGHQAEVADRIRTSGVGEQVSFVGAVEGEAKAALYRNADLFVLPTFSENFGVVVAEALTYGLPVLTTRGAPWADLETFGCGWWIDTGVEPLAQALREAMALSDEQRHAMGVRGRAYVRRYDWRDIAAQTEAVYRWVLGQGDKPDCVQIG